VSTEQAALELAFPDWKERALNKREVAVSAFMMLVPTCNRVLVHERRLTRAEKPMVDFYILPEYRL
jgi:hypothetical protein